ncbi:hypothetical protein AB3N62_11300 [Leptospira sp. WS4.C2]
MKYKLLSIGSEIPGGEIDFENFNSNISLLDYDIVVFTPSLEEFFKYSSEYLGKRSLTDSNSFAVTESFQHWKREISEALLAGKTIIINLTEKNEFYVDSGQRTYSGTGRNQKTTRIVNLLSNYDFIPFKINFVSTSGKGIKLENDSNFSQYWNEFENASTFKVILSSTSITPIFTTKSASKIVGGIYKTSEIKGHLLLLPFLDFELDKFAKKVGSEYQWTNEAFKFGKKYAESISQINYSIKSEGTQIPEPEWTKRNQFILPNELIIRNKILEIDHKINKLEREKLILLTKLNDETQYRNLLYGKGNSLENTIIKALKLLGFTAQNYKSSQSEFDVIFESIEGRFLGEVEGKDNKAVSVDKLRQLEMNILEDLERDEVTEPAKSVLFGNAFRLLDVNDRLEFFTDKCIVAAKRSGTALVKTQDLFHVVQYISNNNDEEIKKRCREAIFNTKGEIVSFPIPELKETIDENGA